MARPLRSYQQLGVRFLRGQAHAALFWDMGLGKTATTLTALEPRHLPALIVAPKRVTSLTWPTEVREWRPDLTLRAAVGGPSERLEALSSGADVVVCSKDNLKDFDVLKSRRQYPKFKTVIIDELSCFKGRGVQFRRMRDIAERPSVEHVWGMTGTPTPNGFMGLWSQLRIVDGGKRLYRIFSHYRDRYFYAGRSLPNGVVTEYHLKDGAEGSILRRIEDICMSMTTEHAGVELPELIFNEVPIVLPPKVRKVYNDLKKDMLVDLTEIFGTEMHTAPSAAAISTKLAQITAGFIYTDAESMTGRVATDLHREKIDACREIVDSTGSPVFIIYGFQWERDALLKEFPEARLATKGDTLEAWNRGEVPIMLSHPASIGHGLNLQTGGHTMIWTTIPWDLEHWQQTLRRLHRSGQQHNVMVHLLMAQGERGDTADRIRLNRVNGKADVQDDVIEHLKSPI